MEPVIEIKPLSRTRRTLVFWGALFVFLSVLPFLYMYATGYRFNIKQPTNLVSTGGIYIAVEEEDADIYIDGVFKNDLRTFRNAFYAQGLDVGTHRIHIQKEGFHTWVKELPVSRHLVSEAEAFNLPLVPQVRIVAPYMTATGTMVVSSTPSNASSTNILFATTTKKHKTFIKNLEYEELLKLFATTSTSTQSVGRTQQIKEFILGGGSSTSTDDVMGGDEATSTKHHNNVKLFEKEGEVFATWTGSFDGMPYYYCAPTFERYSTTSPAVATTTDDTPPIRLIHKEVFEEEYIATTSVLHPVQTLTEDDACDPTIRIGANNRTIRAFDFYPGSNDLVVVLLDDGVYVTEIDSRAWQNMQPLFLGDGLEMMVTNGVIYIYDGVLIFQIVLSNS